MGCVVVAMRLGVLCLHGGLEIKIVPFVGFMPAMLYGCKIILCT